MTYSEYRNQFPMIQSFVQAYGALTYDEVKALIKNDACPVSIESFMIETWREARRIVKLWKIGVLFSDHNGLEIIFNDYNSAFNGNDFEYSYSLDAENTDAFLNQIPRRWSDPATNIREWLIENVDCNGHGLDLQQKWIEMGLHGTNVDLEDYPGGIHHTFVF